MREKVFFEDYNFKITSHRLIARNETIPLDRIESVYVNHRVGRLASAFIVFILSWFTLFFLNKYSYAVIGVCFAWIYIEYINYLELYIEIDGKKRRIFTRGIAQSKYMYKLDDSLDEAMKENDRLRKEGLFKYTDSMVISEKMRKFSE